MVTPQSESPTAKASGSKKSSSHSRKGSQIGQTATGTGTQSSSRPTHPPRTNARTSVVSFITRATTRISSAGLSNQALQTLPENLSIGVFAPELEDSLLAGEDLAHDGTSPSLDTHAQRYREDSSHVHWAHSQGQTEFLVHNNATTWARESASSGSSFAASGCGRLSKPRVSCSRLSGESRSRRHGRCGLAEARLCALRVSVQPLQSLA